MSGGENVFEACVASLGGGAASSSSGGEGGIGPDPSELIRCVSDALQASSRGAAGGGGGGNSAAAAAASAAAPPGLDTFFLLYSASLVFFMQAGFAMLCAGAVRTKNVRNTMLKNFLDACGAALGFYSVGYAFAYGGTGRPGAGPSFIGSSNFFLSGVEDLAHWLFQFAFAATAATIVAGTLAEWCQMSAYLCYSVALTGFVFPVVVRAIWSDRGFVSAHAFEPLWGSGAVDFAGSAVVHTTGGVSALIASKILGARRGRFHDVRGRPLKEPKEFPAHSIALQMLGTFILWFGWYGFNAGSALSISTTVEARIASVAAVNTTLAAAAAGVTSLFLNLAIVERRTGEALFNIVYAMNGCLTGLVSITAGCSVVEPWAAVVIGAVAGLIYVGGSALLVRVRIDDAVDAIPVHLFGGVWGCLAVGLLAAPGKLADAYPMRDPGRAGWFYSWAAGSADATLLACQVVAVLFVVGWVAAFMAPFFLWLNYMGWFRADQLEEMVGLDISYHGASTLASAASGDVDEETKAEYMLEFDRRRKAHLRRRNRSQSQASLEFEERALSRHSRTSTTSQDDRVAGGHSEDDRFASRHSHLSVNSEDNLDE